jgi:hypothetical protein
MLTVEFFGMCLMNHKIRAITYFCCSPGVSMLAKNNGISWRQINDIHRGLISAPQIPEGVTRLRRSPVESGGLKIGREACQFFHSGSFSVRQSWTTPELIPECSLEFTGTDCNRNPVPGVLIKFLIELTCKLKIKILIINNFNVWQPPVAKHWPIISLPPTTTIQHPSAATAATVLPRECPHGPSEGVLIDTNCHIAAAANPLRHVTTDDEPHATSLPPMSPACHLTANNTNGMPTPWQGHHSTSPLPSLRDVGAVQSGTYHLYDKS